MIATKGGGEGHLDEVEGDHDDDAPGEEVEARARFEGIGTYEW